MIQSFRNKETERLFHRGLPRKLPKEIHRVALRKLWMLDAAAELNDLKVPPGNRLERLKGKKRKRQHSIRINKQWRICFFWQGGHAHDVEITDYHA
jgi:toxin HigB-1